MIWSALFTSLALAGPAQVGQPAPDFTLTDTSGTPHTLSELRGKTVVLEWFNPGCPYVKFAHDAGGPLESMAARTVSDSVVWLAINSGAPGKQGADKGVNEQARLDWNLPHPVLMDPTGKVGHAYDAKTTPQMYVVDPSGKLVYAGGLDNAPMGRQDGPSTVNHVERALEDLAAGRPVKTPQAPTYGCSVKYES